MPPTIGKGAISVAFCLSVSPSVAYIANNSRTQRPSMPKFGIGDSPTSFKVKRSKVRVTDRRGHTVSAEPGVHTACYKCIYNVCTFSNDTESAVSAVARWAALIGVDGLLEKGEIGGILNDIVAQSNSPLSHQGRHVLTPIDDAVAVDRLSPQDDRYARATKPRLAADISVVCSAAQSHRL